MSTALRERTINTLKLGHYAERTIRTYIDWLIRLSQHYHCSPAELSEEQVQAYLLYLIDGRGLAWSTVNQALSAFRFLYEKVLYRPGFRTKRYCISADHRKQIGNRDFPLQRSRYYCVLDRLVPGWLPILRR